MSDSKELGLLEEERLTGSSSAFFARVLGSHQTPGCRSSAGCLGRGPLVLLFLAFMLLAVLLVTIIIQVSKLPSSLGQEQSRQEAIYQKLTQLKAGHCEFPETSKQEKIHQELTQLKAAVDHLCRPCPWEWTFFQGNCYFFSNSQRSWHNSLTACQDVGAQLVVIKGEEEQNFLQLKSWGGERAAWIGMSDLTHEDTWQWVDGSPLPPRFNKYWHQNQPDNFENEDCVESTDSGWNDQKCDVARLWICKKSAASCSSEEGRVPSSAPAAPTLSAEWQNITNLKPVTETMRIAKEERRLTAEDINQMWKNCLKSASPTDRIHACKHPSDQNVERFITQMNPFYLLLVNLHRLLPVDLRSEDLGVGNENRGSQETWTLQDKEERLTGSSSAFFAGDLGSHQTPGCRSSAGCLGRGPLMLLFLAFMLLAVLLVTIVIQVSKLPSSLGQEQSRQEAMYQELTQLKAAVDHLCRPCPSEWTFFQGNCYFFSYSQQDWHDSITACQDVGAQLVVIKGEEEQNFLQLQSSGRNRFSWIGMSDLTHEGTWQWVDGSPLPPSFTKHWNSGEPNNIGEEDCVEIFSQGWNDHRCDTAKFWICKKSAASCSREEGWVPSSSPAAPTQSAEE
ncbi:uncharacterized protein LOC123636708 [Lemur catta]|uniref:uncharacterized protein LOC123636708 n=1 Tax=Lemur catta TaxID=9447 RepID=UPI001E26AF57|nr:uncharacterized protein LOC123636708 [Lemur catta]